MYIPTLPTGTPEIPDEIYRRVYKKWREEFEDDTGYTKLAFNQGNGKLTKKETANVGVYSMFSMLGGMLLPFIYGIIFLQEGITPFKVISCALILLSLLITSWTKDFSFAAFKYYIGVFVLNGLVGVIATVHQSGVGESISSQNFMALTSLSTCLIASMIYLVKNHKFPRARSKDELLCLGGYAIFCGVGNLFVLIALTNLPASVQYPFVTGGVIAFSTVIAFFQKEKLTKKTCVAVIIALLATVFVIL